MSDERTAESTGPAHEGDEDAEIVFDHVAKRFMQRGREVWACKDLDFRINQGEMVAVVGRTGCGKSTAFNLILGLLAPTSGQVLVKGRAPYEDFEWFRGRVAVVFQDPRLLPWRTALDNVALGLEYLGVAKDERHETAREWLERLGLGDAVDTYPHQLSGGMRQRVGIARCFAVSPDIILCDESFSALDEITSEQLREEFTQLVRRHNKTGLFITHSIEEALSVGQRVLVFRPPGHVAAEFPATDELDAYAFAEYRDKVRQALETPEAGEERASSRQGSSGSNSGDGEGR